ncbi:hypothetical protein RAM80_23930 [Pseudomonas sp. App30]|uniref:MFS transporter n=1 Tax=Pseudomonas sp. App30 TaxID=3068990 RepID=UPI003A801B1C
MRSTQTFPADITTQRLTLFYFLVSFSVERGLFVFFLKENGYTLIEIGLLQTAFSVSLFLFELPSGYLADKFGRVAALAAGGLLATTSLSGQFIFVACLPLTTVFFITHALSFSLISGSLSSALHQHLTTLDVLHRYSSHYAALQFAGSLSLGLAMIAAAPILSLGGWTAIYVTSVFVTGLSVIVIFPLARQEASALTASTHSIKLTIFIKELVAIAPIAIPFAMIHAAMTPYFLYASSSFHEAGLSKGAASAAVGIAEILSAIAVLCLTRFLPATSKHSIPTLMLLTSVVIAANPLYSPYVAITAFLIANTLTLWATILTNNTINSTIKAEHLRTTTLSAAAFVDMLFISAGFMTYGFVAESYSSSISLLAVSIFPLAGAITLIATTKTISGRKSSASSS